VPNTLWRIHIPLENVLKKTAYPSLYLVLVGPGIRLAENITIASQEHKFLKEG